MIGQFAYGIVKNAPHSLYRTRTLLRTLDGGTMYLDISSSYTRISDVTVRGIDMTPPESEYTLSDDTPIVVVLHGLTGGMLRSAALRNTNFSPSSC